LAPNGQNGSCFPRIRWSIGSRDVQWSGSSKKKKSIYALWIGFVFLTDCWSNGWIFREWEHFIWRLMQCCWNCIVCSQELLGGTALSYHTFVRQIWDLTRSPGKVFFWTNFEDYNGQTYWLSVNLHSFAKSKLPNG
jgi:hypothetical protein